MKEFEVQQVSFNSNGLNCMGNLYMPLRQDNALACIVFANGFSGTMDWILPKFAEQFAKAGFAAFTFDYRTFGRSEGTARQVINLKDQRSDLRNAINWVRNYKGIDKTKIALWGTSLGGSHVIEVASTDKGIAAVVGNMPALDVFKGANTKAKAKAINASNLQIVMATVRLLGAAILDVTKKAVGLSPHYLEVYGGMGKAIFTDPSLAQRFKTVAEKSPTWKNKVAARVIFNLPVYKEGTIERINAPIFIALSAKDIELDPAFIREKFSKSKNAKIKEYPYGHFSMYHEEAFDEVVTDQVNFLKKHLSD
jgi:uncharacterized protein